MAYKVKDIAASLGATALGDVDFLITGAAEPADAGVDDLALAMKPQFADDLSKGAAQAAMIWDGADWESYGLRAVIIPARPRYAMSGLTRALDLGNGFPEGIHPTAFVDPDAQIGVGVTVGPMAVIMAGANLGAGSVIGPSCYIGVNAELGEKCYLRESVRIAARVRAGDRVIVQPGAVIGGDGFSYVTPDQSAVERARQSLGDQGAHEDQSWVRIHSLGSVTLGDDVEIGANACIDRGTIRDTKIGNRTKLDNLVHIGHNVVIGEDCLLCGQVGMAGSTIVGNNVVMAGQVGINDNINIGDNVILGGATKAFTNVPAGRVMLGYPAMKMETHVEAYKGLRRLPRLFKDVAEIKKAVFKSDNPK